MADETPLTVVGNLTKDPELRYSPDGKPWAMFTVASTPRHMDRQSGQWKDGEALFLDCIVNGAAAENVAESLAKGTRVLVVGRLGMRPWKTKEGETRRSLQLQVDEVGPSLKWATARVAKMTRTSGTSGGQRADDPWSTPAVGGHGGYDDEPRF